MFLAPLEPFQVDTLSSKMGFGHNKLPTKIVKESINSIPIATTHIIIKRMCSHGNENS